MNSNSLPASGDTPGRRTMIRNLVVLFAGNAVLGAQMPMLIIMGGLAGAYVAPVPSLATFTISLQMLSAMVTATPLSLLMGRFGRRAGFLCGAGCAMAGGWLGAVALFERDFIYLCLAHVCFGAMQSSLWYFRFAAADAVHGPWKPKAIAIITGSGLIAALLGPEILIHTRDYFFPVPFAGAYAAIVVICLVGCLPVLFLDLAKPPPRSRTTAQPLGRVLGSPPVVTAIICATAAHAMMVFVMTPTALAMADCGLSTDQSADVVRWHVVAMFGPSFFTGSLIARWGSRRVIAIGLALLATAALVAWSGVALENFYLALVLLGVGWNFGFIGSTSLLAEHVRPEDQSRVQGLNETLIALGAAIASFGSGALTVTLGWSTFILTSMPLFLIPALWLARSALVHRRAA